MPQIQPPNSQVTRPQTLTQVGHEGNPVECSIEVDAVGETGEPLSPDEPALVPPRFPGAGSGEAPLLPLNLSGCSVNCSEDSPQCCTLTVSGGTAPYTWEASTGNVTPVSLTTATYCVAATSSAVEPAYTKSVKFCTTFFQCLCVVVNCDGSNNGCQTNQCDPCNLLECGCASCEACGGNSVANAKTGCPENCCAGLPCCGPWTGAGSSCDCLAYADTVCDTRTAQQISEGCQPCELFLINGAVVTVTDAEGRSAFATIDTLFDPIPGVP